MKKKTESKPKKSFWTKLSNFFSKADNFIKKSIINIKILFQENPLIFYYIVGCTFNGILLRALTVKNVFAISPVLADIAISMFFASFYFLITDKYNKIFRKLYLLFLIIISIIVTVGNSIYYTYYNSFISITFISFAVANHETGDANVVGDLIGPLHFIYLWLLVFFIYLLTKKTKKPKQEKEDKPKTPHPIIQIYSWFLIILLLFLLTLSPKDFSRFYDQWNREYLVTKFGVYLYQINDVIKSVEPKMASLFGSDKAYKNITEYYEENTFKKSKNDYTNLLKGKNIIAIHAESMQNVMLGLKLNGKEVTPNLNKLAKTGIYFNNFYSQVSVGTSSDTEFTFSSSLLPVDNGSVFINYSDRDYKTGYQKLSEMGYYTFSMHANTGDFWNRNIMHKKLGYQKFYEKSSFTIDETSGFGLTDKSFMRQAVEIIKEINANEKPYYGTLITLTNHTPFSDVETYGDFDVSMTVDGKKYPYLEGSKIGNYIKSVHYADEQIGLLIELLEKENLLDNTAIVIYGDHDARLSYSNWDLFYNYDYTTDDVYDEDDPRRIDVDYYFYELNKKVPFIIWSNDKEFQKHSTTVEVATGMYNAMPTLANMLGFNLESALGQDIFQIIKDSKKPQDIDNLVVFPNGNFLTNYIYYNDNKEEYKLLKKDTVSDAYLQQMKEKASKILEVSNDIIVYNYFGIEKEEYANEVKK